MGNVDEKDKLYKGVGLVKDGVLYFELSDEVLNLLEES